MFGTTTIPTKGGMILPDPVRDRLRWDVGIRLVVLETADGVPLRPFTPSRSDSVFGYLPHTGPAVAP